MLSVPVPAAPKVAATAADVTEDREYILQMLQQQQQLLLPAAPGL